MSHLNEARYGRACLLLLNVCPFTLRKVIEDFYTRSCYPNLQNFLDDQTRKHDLFHLLSMSCCCRSWQSRVMLMNISQWELLYDKTISPCHGGYSGDCPCKYLAKPGITCDVMDITLCCLILKNICSGPGININHIHTIRDIRNKLIHASIASLDEITFKDYWMKTETAIYALAKRVSPTVLMEIHKMVKELETRVMNNDEVGELRKFILDQKKFAELEKRESELERDHGNTSRIVKELKETMPQKKAQMEGVVKQEVAQRQEDFNRIFQRVTQMEREMKRTLTLFNLDNKVTQMEGRRKRETLQMEGRLDHEAAKIKRNMESGFDKSTKKQVKKDLTNLLRGGSITLHHARGVLIGCTGAGKTTLLKRLQEKDREDIENTKSTRGLKVHFHAFSVSNGKLEARGQHEEKDALLCVTTAEVEAEKSKENMSLNQHDEEPTASFSKKHSDPLESMILDNDEAIYYVLRSQEQRTSGFISDDLMENILTEKEKSLKITMVDFAGQLAYYACHHMYFTDKAFYILVLDMTKKFSEIVGKDKEHHRRSIFSLWTYKDYLKFWIHSIKTFGNKRAPVFFVASHAEGKTEDEIDTYFNEVLGLVPDDRDWLEETICNRKYALALKEFNDKKNMEALELLKENIVEVVQEDLDSSMEVRASWALIEDLLRKTNLKILSRYEIRNIQENIHPDYRLANETEVSDFLKFFHDNGVLLYFNEKDLKQHVILDIQWFADIFCAAISNRSHFLEDNVDENIIQEWEKFDNTGVLTNELFDALCHHDKTFLDNRDIVLSYMEKLRMIAALNTKRESWYVPCMNKKQVQTKTCEEDAKSSHIWSGVLAIFIFFRLIVHSIAILKWQSPLDKHASRRLFQTKAFFEYGKDRFVVGICNDEIQIQFREEAFSETQQKITEALKEAARYIEQAFYYHHTDDESRDKKSMNEEVQTYEEDEISPRNFRSPIQEQENYQKSLDVTGRVNSSSAENLRNLYLEAEKDYKDTKMLLCRDSKDNAVIIGYSAEMPLRKIEKPVEYKGQLLIKHPRNVSNEAFTASNYCLEKGRKLDAREQDIIQRCITKHSSHLWESHSNLTMISGDCVKYTGGLPKDTVCVVLYCLSKGFIPFEEDLFPTCLGENGDEVEVDVREGYFLLGPTDLSRCKTNSWNDPVCMGSCIGKEGNMKSGSVGPFVNLPNNNFGFITCCHVLFDCIQSPSFDKPYKEPNMGGNDGTNCNDSTFIVQPSLDVVCEKDIKDKRCGFVRRTVFKPEKVPVSVDAALVQMTNRIPNTGHFSTDTYSQILQAGYAKQSPPMYTGGKIIRNFSLQERENPLIKSGTTTGLTKGHFKQNGLEVSIEEASLGDTSNSPKRVMKGQYEIESHGKVFFDLGDSGSGVFLKYPDGSLKCIGIAIGRTSSFTTVVTPIYAVLQALGLEEKDMTNFGNPMETD